MVELPRFFRSTTSGRAPSAARWIGFSDDAIGDSERVTAIAALFPDVMFRALGPQWPERPDPSLLILLVGLDGGKAAEVEAALRRLEAKAEQTQVVVCLRHADVTTTRQLMRAGAADVLPAPVSEPALALCLERLLSTEKSAGPGRAAGQAVAMLKAGGGVGATALAVQMAAILAAKREGEICVADLDLQFGSADVYLDLPEAISITDFLSTDPRLSETPFSTALATHRSGARLLAAPRSVVPLDLLTPTQISHLLAGLKRSFALTILDLPAAWMDWTNEAIAQSDKIAIVTHLSVPHIQMVKRQLRILTAQKLDDRPIILVCNDVSSDEAASLPIKSAERALGRAFDVVVPEDRRLMTDALNQGAELSAVRRGTKLEKAVGELARQAAIGALQGHSK